MVNLMQPIHFPKCKGDKLMEKECKSFRIWTERFANFLAHSVVSVGQVYLVITKEMIEAVTSGVVFLHLILSNRRNTCVNTGLHQYHYQYCSSVQYYRHTVSRGHFTQSVFAPDLRKVFSSGGSKGGAQGTRAPTSGPKFLHFHAVFRKNWSNNRLAPPLWDWRTPLWEILDPPLFSIIIY